MLWAIDKRCRHFHRFVSGSGLDSASARNALSSVAASGDSEGHGLPAIWGHAPSSSGIFSDLFGIARPIGQVICGALRTEQAADIGGMVGAGIEVGEIVDPGRKVHGAVGGPVERALDSRPPVVAGEKGAQGAARPPCRAPGAGSALEPDASDSDAGGPAVEQAGDQHRGNLEYVVADGGAGALISGAYITKPMNAATLRTLSRPRC